MPFKVKDLMIDILPDPGGGGIRGACCALASRIVTCLCLSKPITCLCLSQACTLTCPCLSKPCTGGCTLVYTICCGSCPVTTCFCVSAPPTYLTPQEGIATPENLATLKAQLRQALAEIEVQERVMEESLRPQSLEEVEALEEKLTEALEELRNQREELRRRESEER